MFTVHDTFQAAVTAINHAGYGDVIRCSSEKVRRHAYRYAQYRGRVGEIRIKSSAPVRLVPGNPDLYEGETRRSKAPLKLVRLN